MPDYYETGGCIFTCGYKYFLNFVLEISFYFQIKEFKTRFTFETTVLLKITMTGNSEWKLPITVIGLPWAGHDRKKT